MTDDSLRDARPYDARALADSDLENTSSRSVSASLVVEAPTARIFELIADPAEQPRWDGNDNLGHADAGQRVHAPGDVFVMHNANGAVRENHVVEFDEGRRIAWMPAEEGGAPIGQVWRWELVPVDDEHTLVIHSYDWSKLTDEKRLARARATTSDRLLASIERLAALVEPQE